MCVIFNIIYCVLQINLNFMDLCLVTVSVSLPLDFWILLYHSLHKLENS